MAPRRFNSFQEKYSRLTPLHAAAIRGEMSVAADPNRIHRLSGSQKLLVWVGALLIRILCATLRYRITDEAGFFKSAENGPVIALIWHNRILSVPVAFERRYPKRKGLLVLTSASKDGAFLSEMVGRFGMGSIRGSSSRRGAAALLDILRSVRQGYDLCITPDGPRGPRYKLGEGAILVSQRGKAPIMPVHIEYSSCWRLRSWDGFMIPKPFTEVALTLMPFVEIGPTATPEEFETQRRRVETIMTERLRVL
jgi:lysophospholipid acyltransferase (LPLAT)-like uncharacterized protein